MHKIEIFVGEWAGNLQDEVNKWVEDNNITVLSQSIGYGMSDGGLSSRKQLAISILYERSE